MTTTRIELGACGCVLREGPSRLTAEALEGALFPAELGVTTYSNAQSLTRGTVCLSLKVFLLVTVIVLACIYPGLAAVDSAATTEVREAIRGGDQAALSAVLMLGAPRGIASVGTDHRHR